MLTAGRARLSRRGFLMTATALIASACARPAERPAQAVPAPGAAEQQPELQAFTIEARSMLSDTLATLQTFEVLQAFRVSTAADSSPRQPSQLVWDPPTGAEWDEATHVTRGLRGRADQLFHAVTADNFSPTLWRDQRRLADATHDLFDLADALGAYRDRVELLPPGDASAALGLLDKAWAQWDVAAARWGISRAEPIGCAS